MFTCLLRRVRESRWSTQVEPSGPDANSKNWASNSTPVEIETGPPSASRPAVDESLTTRCAGFSIMAGRPPVEFHERGGGNHVNVNSSLSSIAFSKRMRKAAAVGTVCVALVAACSRGDAAHTAPSDSGKTTQAAAAAPTPDLPNAATAPEFATVSKLINDAIAADELPGAVVVRSEERV